MKENQNSQWVNDLRREHLRGSTRNPGAAALMSFFVMGLGQIYAGHIDRGMMLMSVYFGGIFAAFSTYHGGIIYNAVFPMLGAHLMVIATYVLSVVFILLWIYNIKDAYYLSLFSSFRDWFEVERVLLPILQNPTAGLLREHSRATGLLTQHPQAQTNAAAVHEVSPSPVLSESHEDADIVVEVAKTASTADTDGKDTEDTEDTEDFEPGQVIYSADFGAMKVSGQSWKIYVGLVMIFILVGLWLDKSGSEGRFEQNTHFAVAADMRPAGKAAGGAPSVLPVAGSAMQSNEVVAVENPAPAVPVVVEPPAEVDVSEVPAAAPPFVSGIEMVKAGNYPEAARLFVEDLATNEPDKGQWRIILNSFYRADDMVAYELNLRRYLETYHDDTQAWLNLGKLLYDRSELAQASQAIMKGLRSDAENVRGNYLLGSIYLDLKLFPESVAALEKAVALEPLNIDFNRQLARALSMAGRPAEARRYFQRILSLAPDDAEARQNIDVSPVTGDSVVVVQGKGSERLVEKQTAETLDLPVSGKILFEAGSENSTAIVEPAARVISPAVAVAAPVAAPVKTTIVPAAEPAIVVAAATPVPEKMVDKPVKPVAMAPVQASLPVGKVIQAAPSVVEEPAVVTDKKRAEQMRKAGLAPDEAVREPGSELFRDSVAQEVDPDAVKKKIEEFRKKGAAEFSRGKWEAALPNYLEVLKLTKDAQTYDMIGVIFEKLSMHKDAFDAIERSYKLGRRDSVTLTRLGRLAETTGNFAKGEQYLRQALEISPHRIDLRIRYAKCLEANGKASQAIAELEKIARAGGDSYALKRRAELEINRIKAAK